MPPDALYVHLPFCRSVCPYCDFPVAPYRDGRGGGAAAYLGALEAELRARAAGLAPRWIYVGGGTPTELAPAETESVLASLAGTVRTDRVEEWTVEANPKTLRPEVLGLWRGSGATRLSLGAQGFDAARLKRLGRAHRAADIAAGVDLARRAGFAQVNLDLIVAVPGETAEDAAADARAAAALRPDHVSVYTLTVEEGTPFARLRAEGRLAEAPAESQAAQVLAARETLADSGLLPYEVSNLARPGCECRMNLGYWRGGDYLGVGVGAASHEGGRRRKNLRDVPSYVEAVRAGRDPVAEDESLTPERRAREMAMLGFRLAEGFSLAEVSARAGVDATALLAPALLTLSAEGIAAWEGDSVRPTPRGLLLADAAARRVLADPGPRA